MDREDKISIIIEFLDKYNLKIIEAENLGAIIIDADYNLDKEGKIDDWNELIEKGLTDEDIKSFSEFLETENLMIIEPDKITGVSFENLEHYIDDLDESELWENEENDGVEKENGEEDEKCLI